MRSAKRVLFSLSPEALSIVMDAVGDAFMLFGGEYMVDYESLGTHYCKFSANTWIEAYQQLVNDRALVRQRVAERNGNACKTATETSGAKPEPASTSS